MRKISHKYPFGIDVRVLFNSFFFKTFIMSQNSYTFNGTKHYKWILF